MINRILAAVFIFACSFPVLAATDAENQAMQVCNSHRANNFHMPPPKGVTLPTRYEPGFEGCAALEDNIAAASAAAKAAKDAADKATLHSLMPSGF